MSQFIALARVVQKVDNSIHRINHYPANSVVCFVNIIYPLDSDLSGGQRYQAFEQLEPDVSSRSCVRICCSITIF